MDNFGDLIKTKREEKEMLQRHLAAELDIDTAQLSKIERGERTAKREHVEQLIRIFHLDKDHTMALWLADQIESLVENEKQAVEALNIVIKQIAKK